jgi:DNA-binding GntR family transcriptional regulator
VVGQALPNAPLNKQDWAYSQLREWILNGTLAPGQRLDQDTMANMLSISRIPLRQALSRLYAQGFVDHRPNQSWVVSPVSLADARDVYAGREALEVLLTDRAIPLITPAILDEVESTLELQVKALDNEDLELARQYDFQFHDRIHQVADMNRTLQAQQQLRAMSDRYIAMYMSDIDRALSGVADHRTILDALRAGDADAARAAVSAHVRGGIELLETLLT